MNAAIGNTIRFVGYGKDVPDEERLLEDGSEFEVVEVNKKDKSVSVRIDNPDFNKKKKASDDNPETVLIDIFEEEFELVDDEAEAPAPVAKGRAAAKPAAKGKAKAAPEPEPEDEPEEVVEEAPKAKGKAPAKAAAKPATKPAAKGKLKPKAKPEPESDDPYADLAEADEDEEILGLVNEAGDGLLDLALEVVEEAAATEYKLGGILFHVRKSEAFKTLDKRYADKGGFGLYVSEQLNIEYRKAMYLVDIYYKTNKFGIDPAEMTAIGWSKAAKIAAVMTEENADELLELAKTTSVAELSENIKTNYKEVGGTKGEKKKLKLFKFKLFEDQGVAVEGVLAAVAAAMGLKHLDDAFEHIVMEWATEHPLKKPVATKAVAPTKAAPVAAKKPVSARAK
jgi:hypothetical protein